MKTNKEIQYNYLLDCICNCSLVIDEKENATQEEAVTMVYNEIARQYKGYTNGYYNNFREYVEYFLHGMGMNTLDFTWCDIINIGKSWGYCKNAQQENNFVNNWFACNANNLCEIFNRYGHNVNI